MLIFGFGKLVHMAHRQWKCRMLVECTRGAAASQRVAGVFGFISERSFLQEKMAVLYRCWAARLHLWPRDCVWRGEA